MSMRAGRSQALETGAEVEQLRGEAAERLRCECEAIGAFLRF
jgi:hypothetical protein